MQNLGMSKPSLDAAVEALREGGIVAFPTETYYGLAVDPGNDVALEKLYRLKKRAAEKAILILVEDIAQISQITTSIPHQFLPLMKKYWPGPLTLIFPARDSLSSILTGGSGTIGVRISPHPVAMDLVTMMGKPITATSANISGKLPAKSAGEVAKIFGRKVDYIYDGGVTAAGQCSTIIGLRDNSLTLFRKGQIDVSTDL